MLLVTVRFVVGWIVILLVLSAVPAIERFSIALTIANLVAVARALGLSASPAPGALAIAGVTIKIVPDCTPLLPTVALSSAILAFPATWRSKALGIVGGACVLWLYNLSRIFTLVPVLRFEPAWFPFIHAYLWQTLTLLAILGIFIYWMRLQKPRAVRS